MSFLTVKLVLRYGAEVWIGVLVIAAVHFGLRYWTRRHMTISELLDEYLNH